MFTKSKRTVRGWLAVLLFAGLAIIPQTDTASLNGPAGASSQPANGNRTSREMESDYIMFLDFPRICNPCVAVYSIQRSAEHKES